MRHGRLVLLCFLLLLLLCLLPWLLACCCCCCCCFRYLFLRWFTGYPCPLATSSSSSSFFVSLYFFNSAHTLFACLLLRCFICWPVGRRAGERPVVMYSVSQLCSCAFSFLMHTSSHGGAGVHRVVGIS
ncbi:hypothetical protein BC567DRAFT_237024 [Phyllosticta citribraziliensis]